MTASGPAPRTLILSGGGAYADPWHPFTATSARLAELIAAAGHQVEVTEDVAAAMADLDGWDLIVTNAADGPEADTSAAAAGLAAALDRGVSVLAVHVGASTLLRLPEWEAVTGARWIAGKSGHPPVGPCRITTYPGRHPVAGTVADFDITDERYARLRTADGLTPLAAHELDGTWYPLLWARETGGRRVVTDLLGNDARSFDSPEHCELITRAARWLTRTL